MGSILSKVISKLYRKNAKKFISSEKTPRYLKFELSPVKITRDVQMAPFTGVYFVDAVGI